MSPTNSSQHKVQRIFHAYMTEVGLGRIQALGPKWVAGYGPCRKWALLWGGKKRRTSQDTITSCPGQQSCASGMVDQLATCSANLLGQLSAVSLAEPEGSKCSCWPGNLRRSISHSSCSWPPPRRCDLVPFRRLLGDLDGCSRCLEGLADSDSWPEGAEGRTMPLSATDTGPEDGPLSEFSILQGNNRETSVTDNLTIKKQLELKQSVH